MKKLGLALLVIFLSIYFLFFFPVGEKVQKTEEFSPLQDDRLAETFCPQIIPHELYGAPEIILYRLAKDKNDNYYLACHPVYAHEKNPHTTFWAFLNRILYTGGLSLQRWIFGPKDIELFVVKLNKNLKLQSIEYEDADWELAEKKRLPGLYKDFLVIHQKKTLSQNNLTLCFAISSWNHMHSPRPMDACQNIPKTPVAFFSEELWQKYGMTKTPPTLLRKHRAFRNFEILN